MLFKVNSYSENVHQIVQLDDSGKLVQMRSMVIGDRVDADFLCCILATEHAYDISESAESCQLPTTQNSTTASTPTQEEIIPCNRPENCSYFRNKQCDGKDVSFCYATE